MKKAGDTLLNILFPRRCPWCDKVIGFTGEDCCVEHLEDLRLPNEPIDLREKGNHPAFLSEVWACYRYKDVVKNAIWRLKFGSEEHLAELFGRELAAKADACDIISAFDVIVPVPVSDKTRKTRGYNQAALMAKSLAMCMGLPCENGALSKSFDTARQMDLGRKERKSNVVGVFDTTAAAEKLAGKSVLLVDDVITTGSTLDECAKMLLAAGAAQCGALCLAST